MERQGGVMRLRVRYRADVLDLGWASEVVDGDGVRVESGDGVIEVRLFGIDAPERNQAGGRDALRMLRGLVEHREVRIRRYEQEGHGRVVADLEVEGVGRVSVAMVRAGWAWWYRRYAWGDVELQEAEREARAARRGLWQGESPTAPWLWRSRRARKRD